MYQYPTSTVPAHYKQNHNCKECGHISAIDLDQIFMSTS